MAWALTFFLSQNIRNGVFLVQFCISNYLPKKNNNNGIDKFGIDVHHYFKMSKNLINKRSLILPVTYT